MSYSGPFSHSEYEGGGVMPNTVFPKGSDALTASDKLRLQSISGQETDSRAPVNPFFWDGGTGPDLVAIKADLQARADRAKQLAQSERDRYTETPRNY